MRARRLRVGVAATLALASCSPRGSSQVEPVRFVSDVQFLSVGQETRIALILHSGRLSLRAPVEVPARGELSFGYAVGSAMRAADASRGGELAPVTLSVTLRGAKGGRSVVVFERRLDPRQPEQRRWFDAHADLAAFAGQRVQLDFAMRPEAGGTPPIAGFWEPTLRSAGSTPSRPNLLVVSLDTLRARNVGAYGHARDTTPCIDELALAGALFENAITASVTTGPAHMSLFTGLYPVNHGMRSGLEARRPAVKPAAALLRAGGYHTAAYTENGFIIRPLGFGEGFSEYTENPGDRRTAPGDARRTFRQAEHWLSLNRRQPFFLFVHTYQVHAPFQHAPETASLFRDDGEPGTASPALRREHDDYDREIRYVDARLRELVAALERHGLRDTTTLVVLSDHGEEFGEHGAFQHGTALFEETLRVPLIFSGAGIPAGRRIPEQVSLIDVLPTLLELAGVAAPAGLDGRSLLAALRGETTLPPRTLFAEATGASRWLLPSEREDWNPPLVAARSQQTKLLVHRPEQGEAMPPLRFDLEADALERAPEPLAGDDLAAAEGLIDDYLRGRPDPTQVPADTPALDPALRERLESLGYVVDDAPEAR